VERKYVDKIPVDPITEKSNTWVLLQAELPFDGIENVRSGAQGLAKDGSRYVDW
jgi:general secretion pathway protein G